MTKLENFLDEKCAGVVGEENRHEYWDWYQVTLLKILCFLSLNRYFQDWQTLIETLLEDFRDRHGLSSKEVFFYLREAQDDSKAANAEIEFFLSALEFERFVELLKHRRVSFIYFCLI